MTDLEKFDFHDDIETIMNMITNLQTRIYLLDTDIKSKDDLSLSMHHAYEILSNLQCKIDQINRL